MALDTYKLMVGLVDLNGEPIHNKSITVEAINAGILNIAGAGTLLPAPLRQSTDQQGQAEFNLLPSAVAGNYRIVIDESDRVFSMPAKDVTLSDLGHFESGGGGSLPDPPGAGDWIPQAQNGKIVWVPFPAPDA